MKRTVHLYDLLPPGRHRWIPGDQYPRALVRTLLRPFRGRPPGGLAKVTKNLGLGLDRLGQPWRLHHQPDLPSGDDLVGILHGPLEQVRAVARARRCVTGVGVLNFPDEWPTMFQDTQVKLHLQSCEWAADYYRPAFGDRIRVWAFGIDADRYAPRPTVAKEFDFLVYNKLRWPQELPEPALRDTVLQELTRRGLSFHEIKYGQYPGGREEAYHDLLARSRAMLFLCENETQGAAYNEALSMEVPILAWNPLKWLDPGRHKHGLSDCPASSVPYWDERCGEQFHALAGFVPALDCFLERVRSGHYHPRDYVLDNLRLDKCAQNYLTLLDEASTL